MTSDEAPDAGATITAGRAVMGIELGSTRIKAVLVDPSGRLLAAGNSDWENQLVDRVWTYALDAVWSGVQAAVAALLDDAQRRHGARPSALAAVGVSAMMHGYLVLDADDELLVPFRTWRNTSTGPAAATLTERFAWNVPLRWSVAHLFQAVLDEEPHVPQVRTLTTLAGYVHQRLTGRRVLGVGDASGVFPIDSSTGDYDGVRLAAFDALVADRHPGLRLRDLLPEVLPAGADAGHLTEEGARLLDPTGSLVPGARLCPPEGDAGTGMVATNAIAPRTGNVSVGTSIFAMVVLERPLQRVHPEVDLVTTPVGDLVAMVHCNNGASELGAWAGVLGELARAVGATAGPDEVFGALLRASLEAEPDAGGVLSYNYLAGEPITGSEEGRPLVLRTPGSSLTLANFARSQLFGVFATLSLGMEVLAGEQVELDAVVAHGGLFRTEGVAQRALAAALGTPVAVGAGAAEGGAWGIALLACYLEAATGGTALSDFLERTVFAGSGSVVVQPDPVDVSGFAAFLARYRAGLAVQHAASTTI